MDVQNRKKFVMGIGWLLLGLFLLAVVVVKAFRYPIMDYFQIIILTLFVFFFGITSILQSYTPSADSRPAEDTALVNLKCNNVGFLVAYFTCFISLVIVIVITWFVKEIAFVYVALTLTGILIIMWISQIAARLYYETRKNKKSS